MAVSKINGFRAPYRSQTFQRQIDALARRSGLVAISDLITQAGPTITIPAFTMVQSGLIIEKDVSTILTAPTLAAPFYLTVYTPTSYNVDDLVFLFAKSPADISSGAVIGYYDGFEWRLPQLLSIDEIYKDIDEANVDYDRIGPYSGLLTTVVGPNYNNSPGVLTDRQGLRTHLVEDASFTAAAADPDFGRVDRILFRRPNDDSRRSGLREGLAGGTFSATPTNLYTTQVFSSAAVRQNIKTVVDSSNIAHMFCATGYDNTFQLTYSKVSSDRQTILVAATNLFAMTDPNFDAALDKNGNIHVVYSNSGIIKWRKVSTSGVLLAGPFTVSAQATPCTKPSIGISTSVDAVFIVYQSLVGGNHNQIFMASVDFGGTVSLASTNIVNTADNTINPHICVTDDVDVYVAWEDLSITQCLFRKFDDIAAPMAAAVTVSSATNRIGFGTLNGGAKNPKVVASDNKQVFVTFLQDKGALTYGMSVWNSGSAFMQPLVSGADNFKIYDVCIEPIFNGLQFLLAGAANTNYVKLVGQIVKYNLAIAANGATGLATVIDQLGSMLHVWSLPTAVTFTSYASGVNVLNIGSAAVVGGINTINLATNEFLMATGGPVPVAGDQVVFTGSLNGNNGTRIISSVTTVTLNGINDRYVVQMTTAFAAAESPAAAVLGNFKAPDGNLARFSKSTSTTTVEAYSLVSLDTDVLLARIVMPGQTIINYGAPNIDSSRFEFFMPHGTGVTVDWANTLAGNVTLAGSLQVVNLVTGTNYTIAPASFPIAEGQALYITVDELNLTPVPQVIAVASLPWNTKIQVLGAIKENTFVPHLLAMGGITALAAGEADILGEALSDVQKVRLGVTSDTTYESYTSTLVIGVSDSYPAALSALDVQTGALVANQPKEEEFTGDGATTVFTVSTFSFSTDNTKFDNIVFMDGRKQAQDPAGGTAKAYRKITTTSIQFTTAPDLASRITIRKEGTAYGGVVPPSPGKLWSDAVDSDIVPPDSAFKVGGPSNRFLEGYVKDAYVEKVIWQLPFANLCELKSKTNGSASAIIAGKPVALYTDGKIYQADSDAATGQLIVGIAVETINAGLAGKIMLFGKNIPGALTGLGLTSGKEIFISSTGAYVDSTFSFGLSDVIARVGWSDCPEGVNSGTATDLIMNYQKIASP